MPEKQLRFQTAFFYMNRPVQPAQDRISRQYHHCKSHKPCQYNNKFAVHYIFCLNTHSLIFRQTLEITGKIVQKLKHIFV